jgi:lipoate-protein ligase A
VINLKDLNPAIAHENLCAKIIQNFFEFYGTVAPIEILDHEYLQTIPALREHFNKLSDWKWRFGEAPQFNHQMTERFTWGLIEVHLDVQKAFVEKTQIFSDSLHPEMIEQLMASLTKIPYTKDAFQAAIRNVSKELPMIEDYLNEFEEWILQEIS